MTIYPASLPVDLKVIQIEEKVSTDKAEKRRKAVQKAAAQSEITNQMIFSTASGSKWGDYDVNMEKLLDDVHNEDLPDGNPETGSDSYQKVSGSCRRVKRNQDSIQCLGFYFPLGGSACG